MELTQLVFFVSLICFSLAIVSIFTVGRKSKTKHMDDIL